MVAGATWGKPVVGVQFFASYLFGGPSAPWVVPSPDGHHLAICVWSVNANIWMIENF